MAVQPMRTQESRNPRTRDEALTLVKHVESLFMPWNVDALAEGFTEDCVVRFGSVPEFSGREAVRAFFRFRAATGRLQNRAVFEIPDVLAKILGERET